MDTTSERLFEGEPFFYDSTTSSGHYYYNSSENGYAMTSGDIFETSENIHTTLLPWLFDFSFGSGQSAGSQSDYNITFGDHSNNSNWLLDDSGTFFPTTSKPGPRPMSFKDPRCFTFRRIVNTYIIGLMCILGIVGNLVSILVLQKDKNNKVAIFLLQSLAAADIILLILSFIILAVCHGLVMDLSPLWTRTLLPIIVAHFNPLAMMAQCNVVWCTVLLAINRYIAICKPFAASGWLTMNWARIQVAMVFLLSFLLTLPLHFLFQVSLRDHINLENNKSYPVFHIKSTKLNTGHFRMFYINIFYNIVVLVVPVILLICFNIPIIKNLQRSKRSMKQNSLVYSGRRENNITVVMIIIILELVVCHVPDKIITIYKDTNSYKYNCPHILFFLVSIGNLLVLINASTDFIVYYLFRKRFRNYLRSRICCLKGKYYGSSRASRTETDLEELSLNRKYSNSLHAKLERKSTAER